jgi:hypothetical protein
MLFLGGDILKTKKLLFYFFKGRALREKGSEMALAAMNCIR